MCAMPPILSSPSGEQYHTLEEKMEAIANISFPSKPGETDSTLEDTQPTTELGSNTNANERTYFTVCPKLLKRLLRRTSNTSAPGLDGIGWQELKIWFLLYPKGLCNLINELVRTGLPPELKLARVIAIPKPGRRDRTTIKSYRCISLLPNIAKLVEKAITGHPSTRREINGW
jgi:hypothetical protein